MGDENCACDDRTGSVCVQHAQEAMQRDHEAAMKVIEVSPALAQQYAQCQYPELRHAGELMLEWIEKNRAPDTLRSLDA